MVDWYFKTTEMIRKISQMSMKLINNTINPEKEELETNYYQELRTSIKKYAEGFKAHWKNEISDEKILSSLISHANYGATIEWGVKYANYKDYRDIIQHNLPEISQKADEHFKAFLLNYDKSKFTS